MPFSTKRLGWIANDPEQHATAGTKHAAGEEPQQHAERQAQQAHAAHSQQHGPNEDGGL